jgi:hypothetical protein
MKLLYCVSFGLTAGFRNYETNSYRTTTLLQNYRNHASISLDLRSKLENGFLTPREIDKIFEPSKTELDSFVKVTSRGFASVSFSLDTILVDTRQLFGYSYALLAGEISQPTPNPKTVYDTVGSTFKTSITAFGWDVDITQESRKLESYENRFYEIVEKLIDLKATPLQASPGIIHSLQEMIADNNQVTVISSFPRRIVLKILKSTHLSSAFEGRVSPENLLTHDPPELNSGEEKHMGQKFLQWCMSS